MNKLALAALAVTAIAVSAVPAMAQCRVRCDYGNASVDNCGDQLGHMKRVYPAEVLGIDDGDRVWVTEFCPSSDIMASDGNAAYLRTSIADNAVIVAQLFEEGFRPEDVVAVRMMGDDTINLYVHNFGATGLSSLASGGNGGRPVRLLK